MKRQSFKYSLVGFIILIIVLIAVTNIYSMLVIKSIESQYSDMIDKMLAINEIGNDINSSVFYFDKYFGTKSSDDMDNYEKYYYDSLAKLKSVDNYLNEEISLNLQELKNIIQNYHNNGEMAVYKFMVTGRDEDSYKYFTETKQIASYSGEFVKRLSNSYLQYNDSEFKALNEKTENSRIFVTVILIFITLFCVVFSIVFSRMVTRPIGKLVESAVEISKGNFEIQEMDPADMYEIDTLRSGFNKMVSEIKLLIEKIKEKADIEKKLNEQEMRNLLIENMLKEAKLQALQAQINPHFLFNTLNTIAQTSILEDAYETEQLINAVSELLRYSLSMIDRQSKIESEISIIKQYIYIQETRFKDRIKFNIEVDKLLENVIIPGMILQPLVENAFMHGIEGREEGGEININVYKKDEHCFIKVEDNGIGMSEEKLQDILHGEDYQGSNKRSGIGVKNVIRRLKIMYTNPDVFNIESSLNNGTKIYIKIPI